MFNTRTKLLVLSLLVIAMGAAGLYVFVTIGTRESFQVVEPSVAVLWAETVLFAAITGFGIYCWISWLGGRRC